MAATPALQRALRKTATTTAATTTATTTTATTGAVVEQIHPILWAHGRCEATPSS